MNGENNITGGDKKEPFFTLEKRSGEESSSEDVLSKLLDENVGEKEKHQIFSFEDAKEVEKLLIRAHVIEKQVEEAEKEIQNIEFQESDNEEKPENGHFGMVNVSDVGIKVGDEELQKKDPVVFDDFSGPSASEKPYDQENVDYEEEKKIDSKNSKRKGEKMKTLSWIFFYIFFGAFAIIGIVATYQYAFPSEDGVRHAAQVTTTVEKIDDVYDNCTYVNFFSGNSYIVITQKKTSKGISLLQPIIIHALNFRDIKSFVDIPPSGKNFTEIVYEKDKTVKAVRVHVKNEWQTRTVLTGM